VSIDFFLLKREVDVYRFLSDDVDISRVHIFEIECEFNVMMFDLLGSSLKDLFNFCDRKFSLKTVLMLVNQLICRLDYIHFNDLIHRDIKSENCLMSVKKHENQVYVIDLSLATKRRAAQAKANIDRALNSKLVSTARFASVNDHLNVSECNALDSCFSKTNRYSSAASLR
jgi:serine/threonine protein kinase